MELGTGAEITLKKKKVNKHKPIMCQDLLCLLNSFLSHKNQGMNITPIVQRDKETGAQELTKCHTDFAQSHITRKSES